jgi:hypothetical protein
MSKDYTAGTRTLLRSFRAEKITKAISEDRLREFLAGVHFGLGIELDMLRADIDRLKNCSNCCHREVCAEVERRKAARANNYAPCEHWEQEAKHA